MDHLDGYLQGSISDEMQVQGDLGVIPDVGSHERGRPGPRSTRSWHYRPSSNTWQVPTMYLWENFYAPVPAAKSSWTVLGCSTCPRVDAGMAGSVRRAAVRL